ncbi:hypothetical protein QN224_31255 [Sinorhizobium sp. 8-89]|uniref:hypothetical protein n=1 Tax=Sinorhizobium sp. 7-81 TaxID=3049087 RepID=UPI0024C2887E|nr:hypothetical protein [Sinorhizobium sp. 7-81]MDK1389822.1 hypothetical protein [Sinorhizobium sp. 7-81]
MSFARSCGREIDDKTITFLQLAAIHFYMRVAVFANSSGIDGQLSQPLWASHTRSKNYEAGPTRSGRYPKLSERMAGTLLRNGL